MNRTLFYLFVLIGLLIPTVSRAIEHPVSVIKAKAFIDPDRMTVSYEVVYADDLELLHGLQPKEDGFFDEDELEEAIEKHGDYLGDNIQVVDRQGNPVAGNLINIIDIEIPDDGLPAGSLMQYSLVYTFEYKFEKPRPEFLTFQHLIDDEEITNPVEIDITLKQSGAKPPYPRFGLRYKQPETRQFKWTDASGVTDQKDVDAWLAKDLDPEEVGVEGYSSTYSFIYITEFEVRHELLIPVSSLEANIDVERSDKYFLTVEEQDRLRPKIEALFSEGNPVKIDGVQVQPVIDRIDFFGLDAVDFATQVPRRKISMLNGRASIILTYSTKGMPSDISVNWTLFSDAMKIIDSVVIAFDEVSRFKFARYKTAEFKETDQNIFVWKNPGRSADPPPEPIEDFEKISEQLEHTKLIFAAVFAVLAMAFAACWLLLKNSRPKRICFTAGFVALLGAVLVLIPGTSERIFAAIGKRPEVSNAGAEQVFEKLHKNMFRAFDYKHEEDVYDALGSSIDGPLLSKTYQNIRKSLAMQSQGGAIARIDEVQYVGGKKSEPIPDVGLPYPGFAFRCQWNLVGSVEHWAHVHQRTIKYDAVFHVEPVNGHWKITQQRIVDESQGKVQQWRRKLTKKEKG